MNDARARRTAVLTAAAQAKTAAKTKDAEQAIRMLIKRGEPITFKAVQRQAGVSHAFLYNHPELRARIERLRAQRRSTPEPTGQPTGDNAIISTLTDQITRLKQQYRHEVHALRQALERAHGENLDLRRELARRGGEVPPPQSGPIDPC